MRSQANNKSNIYKSMIGFGAIKDRLQKLVVIRKQEGYMSQIKLNQDGKGWYLNELTCSVLGIAQKYPFVCDQELHLLQLIFQDCEIKRMQWRLDSGHSCGFEIIPIVQR